MSDFLDFFRDAIIGAGLTPPDEIVPDGKLHRFASNGKRADDSGWYVLHGDGIPAGSFGDWRTGLSETWRHNIGRPLTPVEAAEHKARIEAARRLRDEEDQRRKADASEQAALILAESGPCSGHPYLTRKGVKAVPGLKIHRDGRLIVPMRDSSGKLHSLQTIDDSGDKRFLPGGRAKGCYFSIGKPNGELCIAEGLATGLSIHEATGQAVAIAFNAGNLVDVAKALHTKYPDLTLIVCADDDHLTPGNPGITKATEAARSVGGLLAVPAFGNDRPEKSTDFNDLAQLQGAEAVRRCLAEAKPVGEADQQATKENPAAGDSDSAAWQEPQALTVRIEAQPYPLDALPETIRAAVEEVGAFVQAPIPLVVQSALAALSLACQAHVDVQRLSRLQGPSGLFLLAIADSGERKSTCDRFFTSAIQDYQNEQAAILAPDVERHKAEYAAWNAEREGLLSAIRDLGKKGKPSQDQRDSLAALQHHEPIAPKVPRLLFADVTPESLAFNLATGWPSASVSSSEGGTVFGSHGMSGDVVMRNLAMLNTLWDGDALTVDRRTSESFTTRGARLTVGLMVQEPTLRSFFEKSGTLARGTGFLARFLVAWPESRIGTRLIDHKTPDGPDVWPKLAAFHRRIAAILNQPVPFNDEIILTPAMLSMTPEAKSAWIDFHNSVEQELASGRLLYDVRDVASKAADNAARLAALFQMFGDGPGEIRREHVEAAGVIVAWHLSESRRFFGELALPEELANAVRLDAWLIEYCRRERTSQVGKSAAMQYGPVRKKEALDSAIRELSDLDRLQIRKDGKRITLMLNPALVNFANANLANFAKDGDGARGKLATLATLALANSPKPEIDDDWVEVIV